MSSHLLLLFQPSYTNSILPGLILINYYSPLFPIPPLQSFMHTCINSHIYIHVIYLLTCSLAHSLAHSLTHSCTHLFTHPLTPSLIHSLPLSLPPSLACSLTFCYIHTHTQAYLSQYHSGCSARDFVVMVAHEGHEGEEFWQWFELQVCV